MSLAWAWPVVFAALAALALPVLLHLDRRRTLRVIPFAALRWLGRGHPARRTWRLTEWLLLALRLLLVASIVTWLAEPPLRAHGASPALARRGAGINAAPRLLRSAEECFVWWRRDFPISPPRPQVTCGCENDEGLEAWLGRVTNGGRRPSELPDSMRRIN